jgi:hypothetical protein
MMENRDQTERDESRMEHRDTESGEWSIEIRLRVGMEKRSDGEGRGENGESDGEWE